MLTSNRALLGAMALVVSIGLEARTAQAEVVSDSFSGATTQLGRIFRDAIASSCPSKAYPGIFNVGTTYNYEEYSFPNPGGGMCTTINFDPNAGGMACGTNAHASAYLGSYDPANQGANFVGDVGSSQTQPFAVDVPGGQTLVVVVTNTSSQANCDYTFEVVGLSQGAPPPPVETIDTVQITSDIIRDYMNRRARMITASGPSTNLLHERMTGSLFDTGEEQTSIDNETAQFEAPVRSTPNDVGAGAQTAALGSADAAESELIAAATSSPLAQAVAVSGQYADGSGDFSLSSSLYRLNRAAASAVSADGVQISEGDAMAMDLGGFNVWAEGHVSFYRDTRGTGDQDGDAGLLYFGADYLVHEAVIVGALIQIDWMNEGDDAVGTSTEGTGWMAGPYVSVGLTPNVFFDARAAWGRSSNEVNPFGLYSDSFDTNRSLYSGKITGHWFDGSWRFSPNAEWIYFEETQNAYTDTNGAAIPEQTISLSRLIFGPEVGYTIEGFEGGSLELTASLKGLWDLEHDENSTINGVIVGNSDFQGKLELGALWTMMSDISAGVGLAYYGLGDPDFEAYDFQAKVRVPF